MKKNMLMGILMLCLISPLLMFPAYQSFNMISKEQDAIGRPLPIATTTNNLSLPHRTSYHFDLNTRDLIQEEHNILPNYEIGGYVLLDHVPVFLQSFSAHPYSTYQLNSARVVQIYNNTTYLAFFNTSGSYINFWLTSSENGGRTWETPILVSQASLSRYDNAHVELLIYKNRIYYLMSLLVMPRQYRQLHLKIADINSWRGIYYLPEHVISTGYNSAITKMIGISDDVIIFWKRDSYIDAQYIRVHNGTVINETFFLSTRVAALAPVKSSISGVETIYFLYTYHYDNKIFLRRSTDAGRTWSSETIIMSLPYSLWFISTVETGGKIHLVGTTQERNFIIYTSTSDGTHWEPFRVIASYEKNDLDNDNKELMIGGDNDEIFIVYENRSGTISLIISNDNGLHFSKPIPIGTGYAHSPSLSTNGRFLSFINTTFIEVYRTDGFASSGTIRTKPIVPIGICSWDDFGISVSPITNNSSVSFRILSLNYSQLFPQVGFYNIMNSSPGRMENIYYTYVKRLEGVWHNGSRVAPGIILEIQIERASADANIAIYGFVINFTVTYPVIERFHLSQHVFLMENCRITSQGLELPRGEPEGTAILGPLMKEANSTWPDVLQAYGFGLAPDDATITFELLYPDLRAIPGFEEEKSTVLNLSTTPTYIRWRDEHFGNLPDSLNIVFIRIHFVAKNNNGPITLNYLSFKYSQAPFILNAFTDNLKVYRGERSNITLLVHDEEDPDWLLTVSLVCIDPHGNYKPEYVSKSSQENGLFRFTFIPPYTSATGVYRFQANISDTTGTLNNVILPFNLTVMNNPPLPPHFYVVPAQIRSKDPINVFISIPGTDKETPESQLRYNYRYYRNGLLYREIIQSPELSAKLEKNIAKKGDIWKIEVSSWDGENESERISVVLEVKNSPPEPTTAFPHNITIYEDTESGPYNFKEWFGDRDDDNITFNIIPSKEISIKIINEMLFIQPSKDFYGVGALFIEVSDGLENKTATVPIVITPVDDPPVWISPNNVSVLQDEWIFVDIKARDIKDNEPVTVEWQIDVIPNIVMGVNFITFPNGSFKLKPDNSMIGVYNIPFVVKDSNNTFHDTLTIHIINKNDPPSKPIISVDPPHLYIVGRKVITLYGNATDPDEPWGDVLTYIWTSNITGIIGNGNTIVVTLPPGDHLITLTVKDSEGATNSSHIKISVREPIASKKPILPTTIVYSLAFTIPLLFGLAMAYILLKRKKSDAKEEPSPTNLQMPPETRLTPSPEPTSTEAEGEEKTVIPETRPELKKEKLESSQKETEVTKTNGQEEEHAQPLNTEKKESPPEGKPNEEVKTPENESLGEQNPQ